MGLILDLQKQAKRQALLDAAYELFLSQGTSKTTINDIVRKAGVAKGTFYLYFKDKENILQALSYKISYAYLEEAYTLVETQRQPDFVENVVLLIDAIIEHFKQDPMVLRVLERNFSWPAIESEFTLGTDPLFSKIWEAIIHSAIPVKRTRDEIFKLMYVLVEMVGSVCYSSIIEERPAPIDHMKPVLYNVIRSSLRSEG